MHATEYVLRWLLACLVALCLSSTAEAAEAATSLHDNATAAADGGSWEPEEQDLGGDPWPELPFWPIFVPQAVTFGLALLAMCREPVLRKRMSKVPVLGIPYPEVFEVALSSSTPLSDTVSDVLIAYSFAAVGDWWWFGFSVGTLVLTGGMAFVSLTTGRAGYKTMGKDGRCLVALVAGCSGLAPLAEAAHVAIKLKDGQDALDEKVDAATTKVVELQYETGPQVILQTFVAISFGLVDPDSHLFSKTFLASMCVSAGTAAWSFTSQRNAALVRIGATNHLERLVVFVWRLAEVGSRALSLALLGCARGGAGWMALVLFVEGLLYTAACYNKVFGATMLHMMKKLVEFSKNTYGIKYAIPSILTAPAWVSLQAVFFVGPGHELSEMGHDDTRANARVFYGIRALALGAYAAIFWGTDHAPNNYDDKFSPVPTVCDWDALGGPPAPCHSCHDREAAVLGCIATTVLMYLSVVVADARSAMCDDMCLTDRKASTKKPEEGVPSVAHKSKRKACHQSCHQSKPRLKNGRP